MIGVLEYEKVKRKVRKARKAWKTAKATKISIKKAKSMMKEVQSKATQRWKAPIISIKINIKMFLKYIFLEYQYITLFSYIKSEF